MAGASAWPGTDGARNKAFLELAGRPLVSYALDTLRACDGIAEIVVVVAPEDVERARSLLRPGSERSERVVRGGAQRQESVAAGLAEVRASCDMVVIHDAARPFVKAELVLRCLEEARAHGAAVAALPVSDTVKEADSECMVRATLDRSRVWLVQTPQVFRRPLIEEAHRAAVAAGLTATDDASLVERLGHRVKLVKGDPDNIKVTYPGDVTRAEQVIAAARKNSTIRVTTRCGIGYDAHRFAEGRPLVLGGVRLRDSRGLLGHSDADVICHAAADALLGAIAAGDIGQHFPDSDPAYRGASSLALLGQVADMVRSAGWQLENLDIVVIAEEPRLAPHLQSMRRSLAEALGADAGRISVKGKTTEGMGFAGRGEGIAAHAVAAVRPLARRRSRASSEE